MFPLPVVFVHVGVVKKNKKLLDVCCITLVRNILLKSYSQYV